MHSYNLRHIIWATVETVLTSKQWISWEWCYLCWQGFSQWRVKTYFLRRGCHLFWTHNQIDAFFLWKCLHAKGRKGLLATKEVLAKSEFWSQSREYCRCWWPNNDDFHWVWVQIFMKIPWKWRQPSQWFKWPEDERKPSM